MAIWTVNEDKADIPLEVVKQFVPIHLKLIPAGTRPAGCPEAILLSQKTKESNSAMIEYLSPQDADEHHQFSPRCLQHDWRGTSRPFGEAEDLLDCRSSLINLTGSRQVNHMIRCYTFGDGFCGAAGGCLLGPNKPDCTLNGCLTSCLMPSQHTI